MRKHRLCNAAFGVMKAGYTQTFMGTRDEPVDCPDMPVATGSPSIMILAVSTSQAPWKTSEAALPALQRTPQQASRAVSQSASLPSHSSHTAQLLQ
mgnify:CR=1 FL=1